MRQFSYIRFLCIKLIFIMRVKIVKYSSLLLIVFLFGFCLPTSVKDTGKRGVLQRTMMVSLKQGHYVDVKIDDKFSKKVFGLYIEYLDFNKKFLIEEDIKKLSEYETKLDDQIEAGQFEFFKLSNKLINQRITEAQSYYQDILAKPFDFSKDEELELDAEKISFAEDKKALKEMWRKAVKYQTLARIIELEERQESDSTAEKKEFAVLEKEAREKVLKSNDDWFKRMSKMEEEDRFNTYMKAITSAYDPHTTYYPPKEKEDFDIGISGQLEGIGATLQEKDGYIKVVRIVPGSASWKQGQLKAGDIILMVGQSDEEPVDIVDMRLDNAVRLIRGPKGTVVKLTVKKVDGTKQVIPIIRDVVVLEETYAKSAVVKDKNIGKKIGYIKLPKFYADFSRSGGRSCSGDVKKEVLKLKAEGIDGIVLDLRDNGGGSLQDVVDMAGLFFNSGPVVQVKARTGDPYVLGDTDPTVVYDGPFVILTNTLSASASEIMAACIQDYGRGVIIGSSSTYGKGTVQRILDLDNLLLPDDAKYKPIGSIKLTTQKFYRVNGGATQLKGVVPDIILPDEYSYIDIGEREVDYSMPWDEIRKVNYASGTNDVSNMSQIKKNSAARIKENETFTMIDESAKLLRKHRDQTVMSLNIEKHKAYLEQIDKENEKYKDIEKEIESIEVSILKEDRDVITSDSTKLTSFNDWAKLLKKDAYLNEALQVINEIE